MAASVAWTSTGGVVVGSPGKGNGMQALKKKTKARKRTAVLFMTKPPMLVG
jgi:hypothetical protein